MGTLYYGDNLDILKRYIKDESVDLVYLDPPFNSAQNYNAFFHEKDGADAASQIRAFEDTWHWDIETKKAYDAVTEQPGKVSDVMQAYYTFLGGNDMMAYLTMMSSRLVELRRILKTTGSLYLHCDPTASHYLKLLLDAVFGPKSFSNEIVWRRTGAHGKIKRFGPIHDTILYYTKSASYTWNHPKRPYMKGHVEENFVKDAEGWRTNYYGNVLTGSGTRNGESGKPWQGFDPTAKGRHWAVPGKLLELIDDDISHLGQHEKLDYLYEKGFITIVPGEAWPIYGHRIIANDGQAASDIWAYQPYTQGTVFGHEDECVDEDVRWLKPRDKERLGYPTQKPVTLLERIICASSKPGDVVLDPFCGCGTTIDAAEKLGRQWVGIDITSLAIALIKSRLAEAYPARVKFLRPTEPEPALDQAHTVHPIFVRVIGEPVTPADAAKLAEEDKFHFQFWALGLVTARPVEQKKGADHGIDGKILFRDDPESAKPEQIIIQVKGGKTGVKDVRDLRGVLDREKAAIGILISLQPPTGPMETEAASAGFYEHKTNKQKFPRLQLRTVKELMDGKGIERPTSAASLDDTFKKAPKSKKKETEQTELGV
jgi:site-specific DNA-methyltransferase (adenine-specific)